MFQDLYFYEVSIHKLQLQHNTFHKSNHTLCERASMRFHINDDKYYDNR